MTARVCLMSLAALMVVAIAAAAPGDGPPLYAATKVDGTDGVYIFRYARHQSMFVVTPEGVIATDPIGLRRPAAQAYIEEIRKITSAPIKYVIYSHNHLTTSPAVSHSRIWGQSLWRIETPRRRSSTSMRRMSWCRTRWSTTGDQSHLAAPRSNCSMSAKTIPTARWSCGYPRKRSYSRSIGFHCKRFPTAERPIPTFPDTEDGLKAVIAMDWERLIPGHPGPDGRQIGTKDDARLALSYLQDLSAAVKQAANAGRCLADAMQNIKLPKYAKFLNYEAYLPLNIERYCDFYSLGI